MNSSVSGACSKAKASPAKHGSRESLRVHGEDNRGHSCPGSILMPRANTDLAAMLAGDGALCVRRPAGAKVAKQASAATTADETAPVADADLARLVEAWPLLPDGTRAAIIEMLSEPAAQESLLQKCREAQVAAPSSQR